MRRSVGAGSRRRGATANRLSVPTITCVRAQRDRVKDFPSDWLYPRETETDDQYRDRVRVWFEWEPPAENETPGFIREQWEYICCLAGISPDNSTP